MLKRILSVTAVAAFAIAGLAACGDKEPAKTDAPKTPEPAKTDAPKPADAPK